MTVNWTELIARNEDAVRDFAEGYLTKDEFRAAFTGNPNPARRLVTSQGTAKARQLAKQALSRRGL